MGWQRTLKIMSVLAIAGCASTLAINQESIQVAAESVDDRPSEVSPNDSTPVLTPLAEWPDGSVHDDRLWHGNANAARLQLLTAITHSLTYLATPAAEAAYENYAVQGFTRDRVRRSLRQFYTLLLTSDSPAEFNVGLQRDFVLYQSVGNDGEGAVHFTGYFEPTYSASRTPTAGYRYPLYQRPPDLDEWELPHPTRAELEGKDGLQGMHGPLNGLELVWLRDRLEAFLVQVQGSARLRLTDGSFMSVGYAGRTEYDYVSIGRELITDGQVPEEGMTLERLLTYFEENPEALDEYLPRNDRFVFFRETEGGPPTGTFSVPVTAGRSIATDKELMPPGAIALITLDWPAPTAHDNWQPTPISRYVLNQDTGGAIKGPGRVDIYVGSGDAAGDQAGQINTDGSLFFLLLKE